MYASRSSINDSHERFRAITKYKLDAESEGTTRFRKPRALGCSVPSVARNATTGPEAF